jgi:hypothetical protein
MIEHQHKHMESKECDLIKASIDKNIYIKKGLPYVFFLFSSKGSKHGKVDQKVHLLKLQIFNMVVFNIKIKK